MAKINKIFISDLHLGDGSRTDDFHRDAEMMDFLDFVEKESEELIIAGDLFELWQAKLEKILFSHKGVVNKLLALTKRIKVTYVIGNHDYIPFVRFAGSGIGIQSEYRDEKYKLICEHGNRYDIFNRYRNPLRSVKWPVGKYFTILMADLERLLDPDIDVWFKKKVEKAEEFLREAALVRNKVTPSSKEYLIKGGHFGEFGEAVKAHIRNGYRIVVFGHTHRAQLSKEGEGIYANCGSWADGVEPTYIAVSSDRVTLNNAVTHNEVSSFENRVQTG